MSEISDYCSSSLRFKEKILVDFDVKEILIKGTPIDSKQQSKVISFKKLSSKIKMKADEIINQFSLGCFLKYDVQNTPFLAKTFKGISESHAYSMLKIKSFYILNFRNFQNCSMETVLFNCENYLASLLEFSENLIINDVLKNENLIKTKNSLFFNSEVPKVSLLWFIKRIGQYCDVDKSTFCIAICYLIDFLTNSKIFLVKENVFRIFLISFVLACKYNEDFLYYNIYYAKVGGLYLKELNDLENLFLETLEFKLHFSN